VNQSDVEAILFSLGVEVASIRGSEILAKCPGHLSVVGREDSSPSWSMNSDSLMHHCFSCGFKGSLVSLVAQVQQIPWAEAKSWIQTRRGFDLADISKKLDSVKNAYATPIKPVPMSEARLAVFASPPDYALRSRNLTAEAAKKYGVLWDTSLEAWILPIRDPEGTLLGWQEKSFNSRMFRNRPLGVKKSSTLFGIESWSDEQMIVVESPLDAVRLESAGISGGVATFGASVSLDQISLMRTSENIVFAFDNDDAGKKAGKSMLEMTRRGVFECRFFNYYGSTAKDIGEMTRKEILRGITGSMHCVFGASALVGA
jgi:DNA primase